MNATWRFLLFPYFFFAYANGTAQIAGCGVQNYSFKAGEEITYRAYYNWKFIWLSAGDVRFSVKDTLFNGQPAFHYTSKGWSLKEYDWLFKVRDSFEAIVAKDSYRPLWFTRNTDEGGFKAYNRYEFDYGLTQLKIVSVTSNRPYRETTRTLQSCTLDVLSAVYYCRTINFSRYKVGDKIPLTVAIDNDVFDLYIRYLGKENLKLRNGVEHSTVKFSVMLVEGTIFTGGEDMTVWVSDDINRIPIMVEAKILIGSVKAVLTGTKGLFYECNYIN